jgi:hypothetical protein
MLGIALVAIALSLRLGLVLLPAWALLTWLILRWPFLALLVYVSLLPLAPDYVGILVAPIRPLNGARLLGLYFLPECC